LTPGFWRDEREKKIRSVTEATSDLIIDTAAKAGKVISGAVKSTKNALSGWFSKLTSSGDSVQYAGAW
jgi:hypothetical protein